MRVTEGNEHKGNNDKGDTNVDTHAYAHSIIDTDVDVNDDSDWKAISSASAKTVCKFFDATPSSIPYQCNVYI